MMRLWRFLALGLLAQAPLGCDDGDGKGEHDDRDDEHEEDISVGPSTGAACDDSLTYAKDIKPIVDAHCTRCHATSVKDAARMGAPEDHNFDTESGILEAAAHIDEVAGKGPLQTNTFMPPSAPRPSDEQRELLSQYVACHL
jgi:uncharacterized membrane protein